MASDRVSELYHGELGAHFEPYVQQACRERIHWMCARVEGDDVLDLGCSQGIAAILLGRQGHHVEGADIDADAIAYARKALEAEPEYVRKNVTFRLIAPDDLPFEDSSFDTALFGEVIEHLTCPERMLASIWKLLRPDGKAAITTPFGLHPDPGHVQTFYLGNFLRTVGRFFAPEGVIILKKYICFAGRRRETVLKPEAVEIDAETLLRLSEEAMLEAEGRYVDRQTSLRKQLEQARTESASRFERLEKTATELKRTNAALEAWRGASRAALPHLSALALNGDGSADSGAASKIDALAEKLRGEAASAEGASLLTEVSIRLREQQDRRLRGLKTECEAKTREASALQKLLEQQKDTAIRAQQSERNLKARIQRQAEQIGYFKAEVGLKLEEVRYRLGDALVRAATSPVDFLMLPGRMAKLYAVGLRRRKERHRLEQAEKTRPGVIRTTTVSHGNAPPAATAVSQSAAPPKPPASKPAASVPAEAKPTFNAVEIPEHAPKLPIKMAAIMDEFTLACFKPECHVMAITPENWKQTLTNDKPDLLFVESAWNGNGGAWRYMIVRPHKITEGPLFELIRWCKEHGVPTVFWNKEDPPNFEHFINAAVLFDHIFTTDENCIPAYRERVGHDRVYALPFAAQGVIHNPIKTQRNIAGNICFAGSYYAKRHLERQHDMDILLKPAIKRGLHIYDRMYGTTDERYMFPEEFRPAIQGSLSYAEMLDAYKRYRVFLNVNSVFDSPTMFSRRVLEILACGTPVISTYALGIEKLLGRECCPLVETEEEATQWLDMLLKNREMADRMVLKGQRRIFTEHTVERRLHEVLDKVGISYDAPRRRVTIITCTNRPAKLENIIANYERQNYPEKEFILVLNSDDYSLETVKERLKSVPNARAFQLPEERTLGACLNKTIDEMGHEYWSKFDDDNFYGANFISDLMLPFEYTEASVIGKYTYYAFMEGQNALALRYPGCEHMYVTLLSGSALIADRKLFEELRFPDQNRGEDTQFLRDAVARGFKLYSADRFNYVVRRAASVEEHTWKISQAEFLRHCEIVAYLEDFRNHVSV